MAKKQGSGRTQPRASLCLCAAEGEGAHEVQRKRKVRGQTRPASGAGPWRRGEVEHGEQREREGRSSSPVRERWGCAHVPVAGAASSGRCDVLPLRPPPREEPLAAAVRVR